LELNLDCSDYWIPGLATLARDDERGGRRHRIELSPRGDAEHALAIDIALLAEFDQIVEQRARHQRPQVAAHMQIGLEPTGLVLRLEAQCVILPAGHPVVHIGAKRERARSPLAFLLHLDRGERRIVDRDADLLDRRDEKVSPGFALEHRGEQLDQRGTPDRRLEIEPGAVGGDAHVEVAAERRVPQVNRGRALDGRMLGGSRNLIEAGRLGLHFFRHDWHYPLRYPAACSRSRDRDCAGRP